MRVSLHERTRRFTVDEYVRMGETGILAEGDRVELLDGEVVRMPPIGPVHASIVDRLNHALVTALGDRAVVRVQNPTVLDEHSQPQPDLVVARARPGGYRSAHPGPADMLLVVEVADSSVGFDRDVKLPLYARAGIAEVWIIDVAANRVEVHRHPRGEVYDQRSVVTSGEALSVPGFDDATADVDAVLGA